MSTSATVMVVRRRDIHYNVMCFACLAWTKFFYEMHTMYDLRGMLTNDVSRIHGVHTIHPFTSPPHRCHMMPSCHAMYAMPFLPLLLCHASDYNFLLL